MENDQETPVSAVDKFKVKSKEWLDQTKVFLKEFYAELKKMDLIQLSVALILLIVGTVLSIRKFEDSPDKLKWMFFLIIVGVGLGTYVWIKFTARFYKKIIYYIAIHKWSRKLVAGGSYCYFEYRDPEKETSKKKLLEPIGITITTLIAFLGISATIVSLIRVIFEDLDLENPLLWGFMAILTPILAAPLIPVAWSLEDSKMKSWAGGNKTNWTVASKYKARFNGFITFGVFLTTMRDGLDSEAIRDQVSVLVGILVTGLLVMFISIGFFIIVYYAWFRKYLREITSTSVDIPTYETTLVERESFSKVKSKEEPVEAETKEEPVETETKEKTVKSTTKAKMKKSTKSKKKTTRKKSR